METKTSEEAFVEYQNIVKLEEKLKKQNRGLNMANADKFFKPQRFFLEIRKVSKVNLVKESSRMVIETNFPFADWTYMHKDIKIEDFLQQLKSWVSTPRYQFLIQYNRRRDNKAGWYSLPHFRKFDILFKEVDFKIGEQAQHEINLLGFDFIEEVKKLLSQQREATDEEAKDFERFKFLLEERDNLSRQLPRKSRDYYFDQERDTTFKITIDKRSYNEKLMKIEKEFKKLCKKYSLLKIPNLDYEEILKEQPFKEWKEENLVEAEDEWSKIDDEEKEEYDGDFEVFLKKWYENYLENNDFDE